ncbi:unnamed protein product [Spirodela intermedia]|uniref:Uncharacterized protein n=1 Tax=Spirodela intermedia TaxID=51605 RepID=A0A7I8IZB6_SPIIN|nr:unnamed protein product [Spirodela intermedia]CAA6663335.1 unnamed protein product [Spirodela intermedia]
MIYIIILTINIHGCKIMIRLLISSLHPPNQLIFPHLKYIFLHFCPYSLLLNLDDFSMISCCFFI